MKLKSVVLEGVFPVFYQVTPSFSAFEEFRVRITGSNLSFNCLKNFQAMTEATITMQN